MVETAKNRQIEISELCYERAEKAAEDSRIPVERWIELAIYNNIIKEYAMRDKARNSEEYRKIIRDNLGQSLGQKYPACH